MDEWLYEAAIRGDVHKLHDRLNEDASMQPAEPLLDRVMRECSGKDNPLHIGALFGHEGLVTTVSRLKPKFARELNSKGKSPLHLAVERGHLQVVRVLLETDADVCFVRDRDGRIPLQLAVIKGRVEVIEELVKAKNITAWLLTDEGEPILHLCAKHDQFDALKKLVSLVTNDGFVRLKDSNDNTILHILSANKRTRIIRFLLDTTNIALEINALNVDMLTALDELYLVQWEADFLELKQILVGKGAKRSSILLGRRTNFSLRLNKKDSEWLERMQHSFLVFAVLVVTVSYSALLNPPGGFWSDDYPDPGSKQYHKDVLNHPGGFWEKIYPDRASKQNHTAGKSILWSKDRLSYCAFYFFNSMSFFPSLAIIGIIVGKHEVYPTYVLWVLTSLTRVVTFSLMMAYVTTLCLGGASWWVYLALVIISFLLFYFLILLYPRILLYWRLLKRCVLMQMTTDHQNS